MERLRREREAARRRPRSLTQRVFHSRRRCTQTLAAADRPDYPWECCPQWRRKLTNKWNSRVFAQQHGCRVPKLYWHGTDLRRLSFSDLPEAYVIRPASGTSMSTNVFTMINGRNLLDGAHHTPDEVRDQIHRASTSLLHRGRRRTSILVEEFVTDREGEFELPLEYKFHVFKDTIPVIQVVKRINRREGQQAAFTADWTPIPGGLRVVTPPMPDPPPPHCLDELLACARRLGRALGTQARLDFYASHAGAVFGELTFWPCGARGYTASADEILGKAWESVFPEER